MNTSKLLGVVFAEFMKAVKEDEKLRNRLTEVLEKHLKDNEQTRDRHHRRNPGPFDPMAVYREQPDTLQQRLERLNIEELKDIIAEHGMDRSKLAMKWRSKERLISLIITTAQSRSQKGDAFRTKSSPPSDDFDKDHPA